MDIRRAARAFAEFRLDLNDVVEVRLPPYRRARDHAEEGPDEGGRPDWRKEIASGMYWYARQKHQEQRHFEDRDDSWQRIGVQGLPRDVTWEEFFAADSGCRQNIANTRPLKLMTCSDGSLFLPRAYAELLDRWEQVEEDLVARARICSRCRAQGPRWGAWRTPTSLGYITLCPPCSGATFQPYTGHLRGVLYGSARTRNTRADGYLCRLCSESRAAAWDHCHDHGLVRGPLCGSCNTFEGKSTPQSFLQNKEGAALHLLECRGCLERRTLPARYHVALARMHVEMTERHIIRSRRCRRVPWIDHVELAHGAYRFDLSCWWHKATWTKVITVAESAALVREFVDQKIAAMAPRSRHADRSPSHPPAASLIR